MHDMTLCIKHLNDKMLTIYRFVFISVMSALIAALGGVGCNMYAQSDLDITLRHLGISIDKLEDLSVLNEIDIDEPYRAIINITGIDVMPTSKYKDIPAWIEVYAVLPETTDAPYRIFRTPRTSRPVSE